MTAIGISIGRLLAALMLFSPLVSAQCEPKTAPKRIVLGIDVSASIKSDQRQLWFPLALQFLACLGPSDRLEIFPIHENTRDSAPLFANNFPTPRGTTIDAKRKFAQERRAFRQQAEAALTEAFRAEPKAQITDLFSLLDRVRPDSRATLLVIFSDGLHSTAELNLERVLLKPDRFPELIRTIAQKHNWHRQTLDHTKVDVILPSVGCCNRTKPVNDREILERFYQSLIDALGGHLEVFDTHMEVN
jgi:hypothetical protein